MKALLTVPGSGRQQRGSCKFEHAQSRSEVRVLSEWPIPQTGRFILSSERCDLGRVEQEALTVPVVFPLSFFAELFGHTW